MLDGRDDGDTLRNLAQLRNRMLARSGLGSKRSNRITAAIKAIWSSVDHGRAVADWTRWRHPCVLAHDRVPDSDGPRRGRWLARLDGLAEEQTVDECLAEAPFDQIIADDAATIVSRWSSDFK